MSPDSPAHRDNNFDALRLAAALMVVAGHAYVLSGRADAEPLVRFTGIGGFGELGVSIFFVLSGFLVASSWLRLARLPAFLLNRCLRILPGLAVATLLTALVLGPAVTALDPAAYFSRPQTWLYPLRNVLLYPVTYALPGVFEANPYPGVANGSLWTLRLEFSLYLVLPLLAAVRLLNRRGLAAAALVALAAYGVVLVLGPRLPPIALIGARNGYLFLAGAALFVWRDALRPDRLALLGSCAILFGLGAAFDRTAPFVAVPLLPLLTVGLGLHAVRGVSGAPRFGDLSYGIYIYAFPVQQALVQAFGPARLSVGAFFGLTVVAVAPLAAASWWLVERPALRLKRFGRPSAASRTHRAEFAPVDGAAGTAPTP